MNLRSDPGQQEVLRRLDGSGGLFRRIGTVEPAPANFSFLSVKTTGTSAWLTWTRVGGDARYLVFLSGHLWSLFHKKEPIPVGRPRTGEDLSCLCNSDKTGSRIHRIYRV